MTEAEKHFEELALQIPAAQQGKMFGALCLKASNGKAFLLSKNENIAIKLNGSHLEEALNLNGATIFEPSEGKKMNGWVQIPAEHQNKWLSFAEAALTEVEKTEKKVSKSK
ncbi:hypothetical protein [Chryseobacterium shigense]|uniref:TfoX N-terminal domain-containing protein n=1 Tax=Chryseobacterium shigense TaxID=297244 RepID=A0A841MXW8_9FLAO|nr:hypothetical protein [Chryseobacterium shigense]MBB6369776.1 hypothetical protein [Chryseobacterium shigense]